LPVLRKVISSLRSADGHDQRSVWCGPRASSAGTESLDPSRSFCTRRTTIPHEEAHANRSFSTSHTVWSGETHPKAGELTPRMACAAPQLRAGGALRGAPTAASPVGRWGLRLLRWAGVFGRELGGWGCPTGTFASLRPG